MPQGSKAPNADVALIIGGAVSVWDELHASEELLRTTRQTHENFCVNDMIEHYPFVIDHAVTLHPEKFGYWVTRRLNQERPPIKEVWSHRVMFDGAKAAHDWGGSVGLLATKIARILGYRKVILCGVPMTDTANHFRRPDSPWKASFGFRRGWGSRKASLAPFVRSWSGWTQELFSEPTVEWLMEDIPDLYPVANDFGSRA